MSKNRRKPYLSFYKILGFYPKNIEYYHLAVRHRSALSGKKRTATLNNERLEFLGDAVLNTVVSDILYARYPHAREGFLTDTRSKIVKRESLNKLAVSIGLNKLVVSTKDANRHTNSNIYGNAMEALMGAVFLDYGYKKCKQLVEERFFRYFIDLDKVTESEANFKSRLIEWCQKEHLPMQFVVVEEIAERNNNHTFTSALEIDGKRICEGSGSSKKRTEQNAARTALKMIEDGVLSVEINSNEHTEYTD